MWVPGAVLVGMIALPMLVIAVDSSIRKKNLTVITAVYFGLLVGVFLNYVAILALTPILPKSGSPVADWLPLILGMLLCYICTSLLLQTRNDFRFLIPYVEFAFGPIFFLSNSNVDLTGKFNSFNSNN